MVHHYQDFFMTYDFPKEKLKEKKPTENDNIKKNEEKEAECSSTKK